MGEQVVCGVDSLSMSVFTPWQNPCLQLLWGLILTFNQGLGGLQALRAWPGALVTRAGPTCG